AHTDPNWATRYRPFQVNKFGRASSNNKTGSYCPIGRSEPARTPHVSSASPPYSQRRVKDTDKTPFVKLLPRLSSGAYRHINNNRLNPKRRSRPSGSARSPI